MVPKRDLTDKELRKLKPAAAGKRYILPDAQVPGFGVRVTDRGSVSFVLVARYAGSKNPVPRQIGDYPAIDLAKARQVAREWREDIAKGVDPKDKAAGVKRQAERDRLEEARRQANTFGAAFDAYAAERLSELRTGDGVKMAVEKHVMPAWRHRPLTDIRRPDAKELLRTVAKASPIGANRIRSYLVTFGKWAEEEDRIEASPFANLKPPTKERARERVLTDLEIRAIWRACAEMGAFGRAFRFMLATGQRRSEVGDMEWREFDETKGLWTIPRERVKADRAHEVPISAFALSILAETPKIGDHVFASRGPRGRQEGTAPVSGWSKAKIRLDELALAELKRLAGDDAVLPEWHLHDLRRTCATRMGGLKVERLTISKVLNHAEGGVTRVYDLERYRPEKSAAMESWGAKLAEIVGGGKVLPFAARG
jgi:integrase